MGGCIGNHNINTVRQETSSINEQEQEKNIRIRTNCKFLV